MRDRGWHALPVDKRITPNDNVAPVIWTKRRLDKTSIADPAHQHSGHLESLLEQLGRREGSCVEVVVVCCETAALVSGFQELRRVGVVPAGPVRATGVC
ncbi:hypothetical protein BDW74DRAFT_151751 [Aspergillus multicolor]|uniref:uncharacterized protein n=1 Tax=Aspergillus multicolor TaxID=41759 RepID=UPI003CCD17B2